MFQVNVSNSRGKSSIVNCTAPICMVGKADDNLIVLQGWQVGRKHAAILENESGLFLRDENSGSATLVNGKKIQGLYGPIEPADRIEIGSYLLMVEPDNSQKQTIHSAVTSPAAVAVAGSEPRSEATEAAAGEAKEKLKSQANQQFNMLRLINERAIARLDLRRIDVTKFGDKELWRKTRELVEEIIDEDPSLIGNASRAAVVEAAVDEAVGLGPLESLLADDRVTEIMVNRYDQIFIERAGKLTESEIVFSSDQAVLSAIERVVAPLGRRIDEGSPMVDGRLKDGSRVNAVIPPLALKGACISIRKFSKKRLMAQDVVNFGSASPQMMEFLKLAVIQRKNILISGGTGSGKTTLLNILSNYIPDDERVVTVEDAAELRLNQPNLVSLESRPPNVEGKGAVTIRELVKNCLRMRPDRIVVGECRGGEALDMLQAMNTGHDGSLTTAHANTPRDALGRVEVMVMMAGMELPIGAIRQQIASAVDLVIQQTRMSDGSRKITHVTEITGMDNGTIQMQDIFLFKPSGYTQDGKIVGTFAATGRVPEFYEELAGRGITVDRSIFFNAGEKI